jgi:hypothetical protein
VELPGLTASQQQVLQQVLQRNVGVLQLEHFDRGVLEADQLHG